MKRMHPSKPYLRLITWLAPGALLGAALAIPVLSTAQQEPPGTPPARQPAPVPPPAQKDVKVLFDGTEASFKENWSGGSWQIKDGAMIASKGSITSKERFKDVYLHVEFKTPYMPDAKGQARGNSGVFLQGAYEVQVLDSYGIPDPGTGDCGALYNQAAPLVNACKPPLHWQTYDIIFRAARFDDAGNLVEKPRATVLLNGIVVQNNQEIQGNTINGSPPVKDAGPISLQDHGNPVEYRNVWAVPLPPQGAQHY